MSTSTNDALRLVLVGGGHAHVQVLHSWARQGEPGVVVSVVSPEPIATYSGMVPGVVARQYEPHEAQIPLADLAARAGAAFIGDRVVAIDAARQMLQFAGSPPGAYDLASFDIGAQPTAADISADAPVVWVKPIERATARLEQLLSQPAPTGGRQIVVVGAGAGGVELSFALRARVRDEAGARVTLCDSKPAPWLERGSRASRLVIAALRAQGITFLGGVEAERVDRAGVQFADGRGLAADVVVWSTGAAAPALFANAGLSTDARGFLRVDSSLRCIDHPELLGAGDCVAFEQRPLPKAGVIAVRHGPVLSANLRLLVRGVSRLQAYQPQSRFLSLLNTCDGRAIFSYGRLALHARWALRLKDAIDRRFVGRFRVSHTIRADRPFRM